MSEQSPVYYSKQPSEIQSLLDSQTTSQWFKDALQSALKRDPAEAARDAVFLAKVLSNRAPPE